MQVQPSSFDLIIIGAGAAGLIAARQLARQGKSIALIEALGRTGGRMHTIAPTGFDQPVELGAEFIHGDLPLTKSLLHEAGISYTPARGSNWQGGRGQFIQQESFEEDGDSSLPCGQLEQDMPLAQFLARLKDPAEQASLKQYAEGYFAADTNKSSAQALCDDLASEFEEQYRPVGGYQLLVQHLEEQCRGLGVAFFLQQPVREIRWQQGAVTVVGSSQSFAAAQVLITVSLGVLQSGAIRFLPSLAEHKLAAIKALGFGHVVKVVLRFSRAFWKDPAHTGGKQLTDLFFLFSDAAIPTWWTQHPQEDALLTAWMGGPRAEALRGLPDKDLAEKAIRSLLQIFTISETQLRESLLGAACHNWSADPYFQGAYSYEVVRGKEHMESLTEPEAGTLYFAGEALHAGAQIGTVEGALASGLAIAEMMTGV